MAKFEKRIKAHNLRRKGKSIKKIAEELDVAKSTVSLWCRDIVLTKLQEKRLRENQIRAGHRGRMIGAEMNKRKKEAEIEKQESDAKKWLDYYQKEIRSCSASVSIGVRELSQVVAAPLLLIQIPNWY